MAARINKTTNTASYAKLVSEIKAQAFKPVYLFWGDEGFLITDLVNRLKANLLNEQAVELDFSVYDADHVPSRIDWLRVRNELQTPPFLSAKRIVLIKNSGLFKTGVSLSADQMDAAEACLRHKATWSCLVLREEKVDKRVKKLLSVLQESASAYEIGRMDASGLSRWVAAFLNRYHLRISRQAAESLIDRCELDMQSLSNELNKLRLYAESRGLDSLTQTEVNLLAKPDLRGGIFDLTDALAAADSAKALQLYRLLRQNKEAATLILFMLARHVKQLICARSAGRESLLVPLMKLPPFVLSRLVKQSRSFSEEQLARMYRLCQERDSQIKWGKMNEDIALESLLISLSTPSA